jgi:kexin
MRAHLPTFALLATLWAAMAPSTLLASAVEDSTSVEVATGSGQSQKFDVSLSEVYTPLRGLQAIQPQESVSALKNLMVQMLETSKTAAFLVLYPQGRQQNDQTRVILTDEILLAADQMGAANARATPGVRSVEPLDFAPGHYKVTVANATATLALAEKIRATPGVTLSQPQLARMRFPKAIPNDPLFPLQWHLLKAGAGVKAETAWDTYRGSGQVIGIFDDGVQITHEDLAPAVNRDLCYDFNGNDTDPAPNLSAEDFHGTACAGCAVARGFNGLGLSGSAPLAQLAGIRLIAAPITDIVEAAAFSFKADQIGIKSNSWGPTANVLAGPGPAALAALDTAVKTGRSGYGTVFLFSGGNDAATSDNANFDGYANNLNVLCIGASDLAGKKARFSEEGACLTVVAPGVGIATTDIMGTAGYNNATVTIGEPADTNYTGSFSGTSASCPVAAGVVALMLEANPKLSWRSVRDILMRTAVKISPTDVDWITNAAGINFNHKFGAGLIDAAAAVAKAKTTAAPAPLLTATVAPAGLPVAIPDNVPAGVTVSMTVANNLTKLEQVVVELSAIHRNIGDLKVTVTAPTGTSSVLANAGGLSEPNYNNWPFLTLRNWGENANGTWKVNVVDTVSGDSGTLTGVSLKLYGTSGGGGGLRPRHPGPRRHRAPRLHRARPRHRARRRRQSQRRPRDQSRRRSRQRPLARQRPRVRPRHLVLKGAPYGGFDTSDLPSKGLRWLSSSVSLTVYVIQRRSPVCLERSFQKPGLADHRGDFIHFGWVCSHGIAVSFLDCYRSVSWRLRFGRRGDFFWDGDFW